MRLKDLYKVIQTAKKVWLYSLNKTNLFIMARNILMEDYQLDFFSNKKGRLKVKPTFGDTLTYKDILKLHKPTEKRIIEPNKVNLINTILTLGFTNTFIQLYGTKWIEVDRILAPNQIRRLYPDAIEYNYYYIAENKTRIETKNLSFK